MGYLRPRVDLKEEFYFRVESGIENKIKENTLLLLSALYIIRKNFIYEISQ